jgi:hypothetical protein
MVGSVIKNNFPSQAVSDLEKLSYDYGLKIAKAIEQEWLHNDYQRGTSRHEHTQANFHRLRLYARGEQSIQKYKDELSIDGDLSYLNLDWKPVPIIPKFVDIVVNGLSQRTYDIKAHSQDPYGVSKRTEYMESVLSDLRSKQLNDYIERNFGIDAYKNDKDQLPDSIEEFELHMQLTYKQAAEIAEEQAINVLMEGSNYELIKRRFYQDITEIGIGAVKTSFNTSEGVVIDYVDPANLVYSHTDSPYFDDIYYVGEIKQIPINELVKQFPHLTDEDIKEIAQKKNGYISNHLAGYKTSGRDDNNIIPVLYFNYKTYMNEVYKVKETGTGGDRAIPKDDSFNPPADMEGNFTRLQRAVETLYDGALILGTDRLLKWEMCKNMIRPKSDYTKVKMNYAIVAPKMYEGRIESLVSRITGFADMIQLTHLKLQQVMARMVPDGVYLDADGLAEVDLGNGTNYNPQEALNMFFQTGSIIGRSMNELGEGNPGRVPIQEIASGNGSAKMQSLIQTYNYYLQMIRDVTGLNEARDGSTPDKNALVGIQKLAAANSNTATRHILNAGLYLTAQTAELLSLRISDILEYSPTRDAFINSIGSHSTAVLDELKELHLYDFGIFIELMPDEEEKQKLENNIQVALQANLIELADAIDLREIKNIKLANQMLKLRRNKKLQRDQMMQQQNIQAQAQANAQAQQVAAQAEVQKNQALTQQKAELAQIQSQIDMQKMQNEMELKKQLMALEFQYNMQLKGMEVEGQKSREKEKEDRKDERTRIQASQQSELIEQRKTGTAPKKFESAGNDILGGGFNLGSFEPK